jgi:hypothetical protein
VHEGYGRPQIHGGDARVYAPKKEEMKKILENNPKIRKHMEELLK